MPQLLPVSALNWLQSASGGDDEHLEDGDDGNAGLAELGVTLGG